MSAWLVRTIWFLVGAAAQIWKDEAQQDEPRAWHPQEAHHRKIERRYWIATLTLTVLLAIGAGASAFFAFQAAQTASANYVATTRAWLAIAQPFENLTLEWHGQYALISVTAAALNKGSSPALNMFLTANIDTPQEIDAAGDAAHRFCGHSNSGAVLLPGEQRASTDAIPFIPRLGNHEPMPLTLLRNLHGVAYQVLSMTVCASYRISGDQQWHHTLQ